jgi:hypothetical protein
MANFFSSANNGPGSSQVNPFVPFEVGTVQYVILDFTKIAANLSKVDKFYPELADTDYTDKDGMFYGAIRYKRLGVDAEVSQDNLPIAFPLKREFFQLPVLNEVVKLHNIAGKMYYEKISPENSPNFNTSLVMLYSNAKQTPDGAGTANRNVADRYNEINTSGIATNMNHNHLPITIKDGFFGEYFKRNMRIHQLALNEGDTLLQGRFGNSIRFSGYIHDDKDNGTQHPAILIRNGESNKNQQKKVYDVVSEDINEDGTSIQITSGKYKTLYDSTTIKVNKEANDTYPSSDQLIGDQIVVNSGRVILSSKTAETFLFSKKKFSIFTDDIVTIDSEKGYKLISQNGNIEITAKGNKNIIMKVNSGSKIFHGKDGADQQAILGNKLVDLLEQLIDAINLMQFQTYMGPTFTGPIDKATFSTIKNQLKNTLSKNNYLI